jgi:integrase
VRNTHIVLRKALADAERLGLVSRNAAVAARPPALRRKEQSTWSVHELRPFLASVQDARLYAAHLLLATTGMVAARSSACGDRMSIWARSRLAVVQTLTNVRERLVFSPPKTARSRRAVALDASTATAVREHRRRQAKEQLAAGEIWSSEDNLVFTDPLGWPVPPDVPRALGRHIRQPGLPPVRLHDLRHTYATLALERGVHPKIVSERLGRATVGITLDLYSHVSPNLDAEVASLVAADILGIPAPS